jgi:hypothetical protein
MSIQASKQAYNQSSTSLLERPTLMHMVDFDAMFWETFYCTSGFAKNKLSSFNLLQGFKKFKFLVIFNMMQKHGCYSTRVI